MLGPLRSNRVAGDAPPAGGMSTATRPTMQGRGSFSETWNEVSAMTVEILSNPLAPPSLHVMKGHQRVYLLASNKCGSLPPEVTRQLQDIQQQVQQQQQQAMSAGQRVGPSPNPHAILVKQYLSEIIRSHLTAVAAPLSSLSGPALLSSYVVQWGRYGIALKTLGAVYSYAHTQWSTTNASAAATGRDGTRLLGENLWRDVVYAKVNQELIRCLLASIADDREGIVTDISAVRTVIDSLTRISPSISKPLLLYQQHFESNYLRRLEEYLMSAIARVRQEAEGDALTELSRTVRLLQAESGRVDRMLHSSTMKAVKRVISGIVDDADGRRLVSQLARIAERDDGAALDDLYWLADHREKGLQMLAAELHNVVERTGRAALESVSGPVAFVVNAYRVISKFDGIVVNHFRRDPAAAQALHDGSMRFVNTNAQTQAMALAPPEHTAAFAHLALKTGTGPARAELEAAFPTLDAAADAVVALLRLLDDRDVFQARYASYLSHRILTGSFMADAETVMIGAIARVTAHDFCYKWRRMLVDVDRSAELRSSFADAVSGSGNSSSGSGKAAAAPRLSDAAARIDFRPLVATQGTWPVNSDAAMLRVPAPVHELGEAFRLVYTAGDVQKKLTWVHSLATAVLRPAYLTKRRYEWTVTHAQASLLLAFDDASFAGRKTVAIADVLASSGVANDVLHRALGVLLRLKVVTGDASAFALNEEFASNALKLSIHSAKEGPTPASLTAASSSGGAAPAASVAEATQRVVLDRKFAVQAAIVRVAKSRRNVPYQELVADVISILRSTVFTPTVQVVKTNIEALIEKEYLERADGDKEMLCYVA